VASLDGKALKRTLTAIGYLLFFDLEYLIRVQSSEPLHAEIHNLLLV
jgi:hypothetical protein